MQGALFTDFYELTMAQGYFKQNMNMPAVFEMFFRRQPFSGGYSIFSGLKPLLDAIEGFIFSLDDIEFLKAHGDFQDDFLSYLKDFRFRGDVHAFLEGDVIFPLEPIVRICAPLIEAQLLEGLILNHINFQSLIATKSARICRAARGGKIMEFGLRRAQGQDGALSASRAAFIGGASGTSNVYAAKRFGIPAMGTMAHSWVMAFPSELEAFEAYARLYPDHCVFLIDTYDTLSSGLPNAIKVGQRLAAQGKKFGLRLDSGDIHYLSVRVRQELDAAGLADAFIVVSNELDEMIIEHLVSEKSPVDIWGVGTHLVSGGTESSFTGVYKLCAVERGNVMAPVMKVSDNPAKSSNPGIKNVYRIFQDGEPVADVMALENETMDAGKEITVCHPSLDTRAISLKLDGEIRPMLHKVVENGTRLKADPDIHATREHAAEELSHFDSSYLRLLNPHVYKVSITERLYALKLRLSGASHPGNV